MADTAMRISIESDQHDLYKQLAEGNNPETTPFRTMKDVFMLAACLGFRRGQSKELKGTKRQIFHWAQFSEQIDVPILKAIAIATTGDVEVLNAQSTIVEIAEAYANIGIQDLQVHIIEGTGQPLWNLVDHIGG
jgi:dnd system-associated protein 4